MILPGTVRLFGQFPLYLQAGLAAEKEVLLERRVVVTGIGLVTPLGIGVEETWSALIAGKSGVGEITRFDTSDYQTKIAAEVKGFNAQDFMPKKEAKRTERSSPMPSRRRAWPWRIPA